MKSAQPLGPATAAAQRADTDDVLAFVAAQAARDGAVAVTQRVERESGRLVGSLVADLAGKVLSCTPSLACRVRLTPRALVGRPLSHAFPGVSLARLAAQAGMASASLGDATADAGVKPEATSLEPPARRLAIPGRGDFAVDLVCRGAGVRGARLLMIEVWLRDRLTDMALRRLLGDAERASEAVLLTDRSGAIEYSNAAFGRRSGFDRASLIGRNAATLLCDGVGELNAVWAVLRSGRTWQGEFLLNARGGGVFREPMRIRPFADRGGPITHFVCVGRDATEQEGIHLALRGAVD